jgi:hypothetical protein
MSGWARDRAPTLKSPISSRDAADCIGVLSARMLTASKRTGFIDDGAWKTATISGVDAFPTRKFAMNGERSA